MRGLFLLFFAWSSINSAHAYSQDQSIFHDYPAAHELPREAPHVAIVPSANFSQRSNYSLVLYFHGWNGCIRVLSSTGRIGCLPKEKAQHDGWGLAKTFSGYRGNALLVMPQLAYRQRNSSPGRFREKAFNQAYLDHIISEFGKPAQIVVMAHSAGFEAAAAWLLTHGSTIDRVVLFDAFYARLPVFKRWLRSPQHSMLSFFTGGKPRDYSKKLARFIRRRNRHAPEIQRGSLKVIGSKARHIDVPMTHLLDALQWSEKNANIP